VTAEEKQSLKYRRNFWIVYRDSMLELVKDDEPDDDFDLFISAIDTYIQDFQSRLDDVPATLEYLASVKTGLRAAIELAETIQDAYADELKGFQRPSPQMTMGQELYSALKQITADLSMTVWGIEQQYPKLKKFFDDDRAAHHALRLEVAAFERANPLPKTH
jgi:hypothetical protein